MRAIFAAKSGSRLAFQVLRACQLISASRSTRLIVSVVAVSR